MDKQKKIVVTGGAGFIGANLVLALKEAGYSNLIIVDHITPQSKKNLELVSEFPYIDKDIFLDEIENDKAGIECIIHLGARSATTETDWEFLKQNNLEYSKKLFVYCAKNSIPFIYASSAATYGDGKNGYDDSERNLTPLNLYGRSKYEFDEWVLDQDKRPPQWAGLKFFNVYGPFESHKDRMASVVLHAFNQIRENGNVKLFKSYNSDYPDGGQQRDFVYVKDVVEVILFFIQNTDKSGIYNVGSGKARTFSDLAQATFDALGKEPSIEFIDMPEDIRDKYQYYTQAKMNKLQNGGYSKKFTSLEDGVIDYVKNYLNKNSTP